DDWKRREAEFSQYDPRIEATTDEELASDESLAPVLNRESFQLCFHAMLDEKGDLFACVVKDGIDPVGRSADWLHMDIEWLYSWRERLGRDPWRDRFPPPDYSFKTITVANWRLVLDRVAGLVAEQTWILWLVKCFDEDLRIANAPLEPGTFLKEGLSNIILIQVIASFLSEEAQKAAEASKAGKSARGKKGRRKVENETMKVANVAKVTKAAPGRVDAYELEHILRRNMVPGREFRARIKKLAAAEVKMYPSLVRIRFDENGIPLPPNDFLVPAAAGKYLDD
nr:hypothetical protein [Candidatus Sigynarchaeota archaeon]